MTIAICNPNFHGDVLWSVGAARELAYRAGEKADFWLSLRAAATADLLQAQSFVRNVQVVETWAPDDIAPQGDYSAVHQLHMRGAQDCTLLDHFCRVSGLPRQGHGFELPLRRLLVPTGPFIVLAAKIVDQSEWMKAINAIFRQFVRLCPVPVVEVGVPGTALATDLGALDRTSNGFVDMAWIISACRVFVGTISAPLVLADAFPDVRRVALHDGDKWNMNNVTRSPLNHYLVYPTPYQLVDLVRSLL